MAAREESSSSRVQATPRHSASMVLINARNEVVMVQRNPDSRSFAGAHVFPGGNFDNDQDPSLQITAIRETFEETGVLLAKRLRGANMRDTPVSLSDEQLDVARQQIHARKTSFASFLADAGLEADTSSLLPFTQWITPTQAPRRFHTRFYVAFLPQRSAFQPSLGEAATSLNAPFQTRKHRLPTPDGGLEVISASFLHPSTTLTMFHRGEISMMPPQFYILSALEEILADPHDENTQEQRNAIARLARGTFGRMVINPRALTTVTSGERGDDNLKGKNKSDNVFVLTYEGDETRGGSKGRLHRAVLQPGKGGIPRNITLIRNFNIFNEIEERLFPPSPSHSSPDTPFPPDVPESAGDAAIVETSGSARKSGSKTAKL